MPRVPAGSSRRPAAPAPVPTTPAAPLTDAFGEVAGMIRAARAAARQAVNTALIDLYWRVGAYIAQKGRAPRGGMASSTSSPRTWSASTRT